MAYLRIIWLIINFLSSGLQRFSLTFQCQKSKLCYNRLSVGQSVLASSIRLGPEARFLLLSGSCGFVDVGRPLWREDGSVVYNCCWSSPAQSFLGPSPAGLMAIFYCLRFKPPPNLEEHTRHTNILCIWVEFVKESGTYSNQWALKGLIFLHKSLNSTTHIPIAMYTRIRPHFTFQKLRNQVTPQTGFLLETLTVSQLFKEFPAFLWDATVHYHVHRSPQLVSILSTLIQCTPPPPNF
jgi:hypothetical protein